MWSLLRAKECPIAEEAEHLGQKIFENFSKAYESTDPIDGIEVLPPGQADEMNANPIVVQGSHLGVALWSIPLMFRYAYQLLFSGNRAELCDEDIDRLTRCIVLCSADCTTAWNARKKLVLRRANGGADVLNIELKLSGFVIFLHPKSSEAFSHRRWVISRRLENMEVFALLANGPEVGDDSNQSAHKCIISSELDIEKLFQIVQNEYKICKAAGERQKSNYNAWAHRSWVTDLCILNMGQMCAQRAAMGCHCSTGLSGLWERFVEFLSNDCLNMATFMGSHVSDISVLNSFLNSLWRWTLLSLTPFSNGTNRSSSFVVTVDEMVEAACEKWLTTLKNNSELLSLHSDGHEALWSFRRNLHTHFRSAILPLLMNCDPVCGAETKSKVTCLRREFSFENEVKICEHFVTAAPNFSAGFVRFDGVAASQERCALRYLNFLNKFLK